jgi:Helix-turn-helix domain
MTNTDLSEKIMTDNNIDYARKLTGYLDICMDPMEIIWAVRDEHMGILDSGEASVLVMLASRGERIFPSFGTLAKDAKLSMRTVKRKVKSLEEKGWLIIDHGGPAVSNSYQVTMPKNYQRKEVTAESGHKHLKVNYPKTGDIEAPDNQLVRQPHLAS